MNKTIDSHHNQEFKKLIELNHAQGIKKQKKCIISGAKIISELLDYCHRQKENPPVQIERILTSSRLPELNAPTTVPTTLFDRQLFNQLDIMGTKHPLLLVNTPSLPLWTHPHPSGSTLFIPLGDPLNLGSLIRSACAFEIEHVVLLKEAASAFHPKAIRSSSGCVFSTRLYNGPSIQDLPLQTITLDKNGVSLTKFQWPSNPMILVGEEGKGVPSQYKNTVSIPISSSVESLNATIATSILLYERLRIRH